MAQGGRRGGGGRGGGGEGGGGGKGGGGGGEEAPASFTEISVRIRTQKNQPAINMLIFSNQIYPLLSNTLIATLSASKPKCFSK